VLGLIYTIKGFEVAASQAAISGELNDVLLALNLSPLIHSDRDAEQLAREMILAHEKWLPNFAATIEKLKNVTGAANGTRVDRQCRRFWPQ
jgi:6-phospho-beta-glucosidase